MRPERLIRFTFVVSLFSHGLFLIQGPEINPLTPPPKEQLIKVRYLDRRELVSRTSADKAAPRKTFSSPRAEAFMQPSGKASRGIPLTPPVEKKFLRDPGILPSGKAPDFAKPNFSSPAMISIRKRVTLPEIEIPKIDNPSYISYYQIVREKIRRSAYKNYTRNEIGEVYISFVISNDGDIRDIRLIEPKTSASDYLKGIASRSVKDASPFPSFPKELDYPQLSFNIVISFELE